jgi:hypothetical protein
LVFRTGAPRRRGAGERYDTDIYDTDIYDTDIYDTDIHGARATPVPPRAPPRALMSGTRGSMAARPTGVARSADRDLRLRTDDDRLGSG